MEKTNLNVTPYYDDFAEDKNFHRVLFRPGFSVQARELTQLQTILQNQVERFGRHVFKEGTVVIPGATGYTDEYYAVKLQSQISGSDITPQIQDYVGKRIAGTTSGVVAEVIQAVPSTTEDPITLYVKYVKTGSDNVTLTFQNGENISANGIVGSFAPNIDSATLQATNATATGSSANIQEGVYFVRGHFVRVAEQRLILDKYTDRPSYRIGLTITESLETPEEDTSLLDNAQGSTNQNAKGAHRLKIDLTLAKLALDSELDENFIELMRVNNGVLQEKARNTEYSVLGETLARRTYDESGDYTVRDFDLDLKETLDDGLNDGIYELNTLTDDGNDASDNFLTMQISPGKAYVRGYEIETIAPKFVDILKPRTFENQNASVTPVEVGNYVVVNKVHGSPEVSPFISGQIDEPYREISLYDTATASRGTASGARIGFARARGFEHFEGNSSSGTDLIVDSTNTDTKYKLYLFDLRMFTKLTMSGTPSPAVTRGAKITGASSGAYGFVASDSSGSSIYLTSVVGVFGAGEKLKSTSSTETDEILETSGNADLTVSSVETFDFSKVKQVFMDDPDGGDPDFTADIVLQSEVTLAGSISVDVSASNTTVNGFQTDFSNELQVGDVIAIPSGAGGALEDRVVSVITDDNTLTVSAAISNDVTSVTATRKRAKLTDQNKNVLLRKLQKNAIKTLKTDNNSGISDTSVVIRRSFTDTSSASGEVSFTASANETFNAVDNTDFVLTVISAGSGGSASDGDIVNLNSSNVSILGSGTGTITITSASILGNGAEVRLIATITRTTVNEKSKTRTRMHQVLVDNDGIAGGADYGTSAHHKEVSLGVADIHKLWAVFESDDSSTNPTLPQWTITGQTGSFDKGELITGGTTGAKARVINPISPMTFVSINNVPFQAGEEITGAESGETATLDSFTEGSRVVTNSFTLDTGQRDNFYDIGRLVRKSQAVAPTGKLMIVFDYFTHGTGDFFSVDSYSSINYKEISTYTATRVDPEVAEPTGEYDLRDTVDFRPRVADVASTSVTIQAQTVYKVNGMSFNFEDRAFSGSGSSVVNIPKDNSNFIYDFDFYVGRIDMLFLTSQGDFKVVNGAPAEQPVPPKPLDNAMKLANINLNPYILEIRDASFSKENNRRYTMRDIGKLEARINNMEYYTALNLLEKDAASFQIQDANGLDRFKSGFVVDNFRGHATGDVKHPDYRVAIDMQNGELRPKYYMKGIGIVEENTTDTERSNDQYQKTGDILTLPYTHKVVVKQPYATRVENLNPVLSFAWAGICKLSPSGDEWFEVNRLPDLIINREGNFDTVLAANRNALGTVWNAWQTQWSGVTASSSTQFRDTSWARARGRVPFRPVIQRTTTTTQSQQTRQGVTTTVVPQVDMESQGDRVVSRALIPFIRARNVSFTVTGMKPLTRVYAFFDKKNVNALCTPSGGSQGDNLITSAAGKIEGVFSIPDPNGRGNPKFRTGDRLFRLTSSSINEVEPEPETFAQAVYSATGILSNVQETIIATRNARVETRNVSQSRTVSNTQTREEVVGWWDPLAQSFMPQAKGGEFITKVDVFFQGKDDDLPVTCQIREMQNGYPTTKVLPFGSRTLEPVDVSLSDDASVPTTFTFEEPVYVKDGVEYCIVLFTDSQKYLAWISRMGEIDVGGKRLVSEQPYLGVLFKSQNNTTWSAYDLEDLKFTLYRASFDTSKTATITFVNDEVPTVTLEENPIRTITGDSKIKITQPDHHMYSASNNVVISGVVSGINTTLNGALSAGGTSLTLTSSSGFPSSGTAFVKIGSEVMSGTISGTSITSLTRGVEGTDTTHANGAAVQLYMLNGIPLTEINKTHIGIGDIRIDSYTIPTTTAATSNGTGGGASVVATQNALADSIQSLIPTIEHPETTLVAKTRTTSGTSPDGTQTSFNKQTLSQAETIPINDNYYFTQPKIICSAINETNELSGDKSFNLIFTMTSDKENLSPVVDLDKKTVITVANRLDSIESSADVYPSEDFVSATEPDGDSGETVYMTRKAQLKTPATALKVFLDAVRFDSSQIEVMHKVLRSDDASDFDEIGWTYFNETGLPDTTVNSSVDAYDFIEREYSVDGLPEFIAFSIKIRLKGTNCAEVPRIKDLRALALAT